jgi:hypothetical protein
MAKSDVDKFMDRVMNDLAETFEGDGYSSDFAYEISALIRERINSTIQESARTELKRIRAEIRKEFQDVKSENARIKAELEFYRGIEAAARKKTTA